MIKPEISKIISIFQFVCFLQLGLTAAVQLGFCQSYHVHNYCEDDGLLNSTVHDLLQDSTGRMWFTTRSGISCYDGTEYTSYTAANGLPGVDYTFLEIDDENIIWALSKHRSFNIAYFHNEKWHSLETPPLQNYPNLIIDFKVLSKQGKIIIAIASKLSGLYVLENDQWTIIEKPQEIRTTFLIHSIAFFEDTIYAATSDGLFYVTDDSLARYTGCDLPAGSIRGLRKLETDNQNRLWLAGTSWIGIIDNHSFNTVAKDLYIPFGDEFEYLLLQPDYRRGIFYGNPIGCYYLKFSNSEPERLGLESGLISDGITSLFMDREKNLWCSTLRGVSKIAGMCFQNYRKKNGLLNDEVTAIVEIKPGSYILGHNNGLTFFEDGTFRYHKFPRSTQISPIATRVIDLAMDREKNVWMAVSSKGLGRIDPSGEITWIDDNPHLHNPVKSVMVDCNNQVWIADAKGLITYDGKSWQRVSTSKEDLRRVRKVIRGPGDEIFLATYFSGLYVYKNKKWIGYRSPKVESANNIYAAHRDSNGRLLVGSLAGLFTVDHDTLKRFDLAGYRLKRSVYLILEDRKKRLWFGTDNGVIRWDGNEIREYNVHNGFVGREINRSAGIIDHRGRVWIGTDLGVSCYREEYDCDRNDIPPPLVKLTEIEVQGERRPYQSATHLGYSENNLVFHFECISFIDENAISFRAKLEGSDKEWIDGLDVGHQQMRYTHLKPGEYQFYVQAKNALGRWSPVITSPEIIISRPLWKQWWFHLTLLFVVTLLTSSIYRFITNKKLARNLEIKVRERTRQLQESEWRYRQMFESNQAVMLLVNPKTGYVMDANPAACNFFGHSHANMLKLHFPMYQNESNDEDTFRESFPIPEYIITQQGIASSTNRDVEIYACPIYLQAEKSVFLIIHDISERLQAEKALAAEKERLAVTLHSIADGVISTDIQGRVNLMNKVAENMTGWSLEKALGKKVGMVFKTVLENSRKPSENPVDSVLKSGRMQRFSSYNILKSRDDKERIIAASASPIHDRDNMLIGVVLVFRDVTKQRKLEEELLRASKIESVGVLAGGIAHDFNNILTGIIGNLSLVMMQINKDESIYKLLSAAEKASYRARDLTQQLLTFSKGGVPIKKATHLAAIVEETAAFALSGSNVHYEIKKPENLWQIMVDAGQINQVIHNLLLNADQAMPSGGIIKITLENAIVQYNSSLPLKRGRYVKLIIDDSGIGISEGDLQKIFDPYFTTKQKGSGLGLATSYSIIKKHSGHISVESRLGKGTMFCVYLPATSSEQVVELKYEIDEIKEMRKVLLMDDDETIRSTTGKMLRYLGYQVETASNGEEAVQKYVLSRKNGNAFDVAIFDLTVRGAMGGKEALQKLMKIDPGIKVIVSSGYSNDPIMANYEKYGFKGVVTKPYEISMLSKALNEVLTNHNE